jgi:hypothetical protein
MNTAAASLYPDAPTLTDDDPRSPANTERRKVGKLAKRDENVASTPDRCLNWQVAR